MVCPMDEYGIEDITIPFIVIDLTGLNLKLVTPPKVLGWFEKIIPPISCEK